MRTGVTGGMLRIWEVASVITGEGRRENAPEDWMKVADGIVGGDGGKDI